MRKLILTLAFLALTANAWAFPTNAVLEDFTGSDGTTPPNSNWTNAPLFGATSANLDIQTNTAGTATSSSEADAYWDTTQFPANQEVFVDLTVAGASTYSCIYLRLSDIGSGTTDGYRICALSGSSTVVASILTNGATVGDVVSVSQTVASGDKLGAVMIGSRLCVWFKDGAAAWAELGCGTDTTYPNGGYIGLTVNGANTATIADNFGGGVVPVSRGGPIFLQ